MKFEPPIAPNDRAPINEPPPKVIALCNHPGPQSLVYAFSFAPVPLFSTELSSSFSFLRVSSFSVIYKCELIERFKDNEISRGI